jgi:hypothetical protein
MLVILAAEEADIRKIKVQSQPGQIMCESLSQKKKKKKKKSHHKKERAGGVAQGIGPEFKPHYQKIYIYELKTWLFHIEKCLLSGY